jgi:hypothetical protein
MTGEALSPHRRWAAPTWNTVPASCRDTAIGAGFPRPGASWVWVVARAADRTVRLLRRVEVGQNPLHLVAARHCQSPGRMVPAAESRVASRDFLGELIVIAVQRGCWAILPRRISNCSWQPDCPQVSLAGMKWDIGAVADALTSARAVNRIPDGSGARGLMMRVHCLSTA